MKGRKRRNLASSAKLEEPLLYKSNLFLSLFAPSQLVIGHILLLAMLLISELFARLVDQGFVLSELGVFFLGFVDPSKPALVARGTNRCLCPAHTDLILAQKIRITDDKQ
ncbi:hypothetical protein BrnapMp057 (mitochondrion) [Brassica napus]|uniref:ORF109 n=12 Tax=Brassiceae TaxID=981071 RepID=Q6YSN5_BRANA|nr:orf109 [Brassica oleracea]YP_004927543.1 orf109 [Brassica carinata]YP_004927782.1 orf109 [Brassica juncea]YP_004927879.1 orf109 [Brassica rapa subsp. oleifera]YP_009228080.1 hypothetical protein AYB38_gp68 [Brassica nigra]YP_009320186.1 orf109a [Sinapis arvensis]YP_009907490.1 hypothetical protein [Brassica rapa]YP_717154.1 hypothetical protein BrnapMp057 [Brassica napus]AEX57666.1 hypothetical protein RasatMp035 [Raphanus sativus]AHY20364.1 hypothetical protein [Brassica juncea var. tu